MTDYKSTIAELRYLADWAKHHLDKAKIANDAAEAIEALQSKLGDAIRSLANWQHQCTELQAENERLKSELDKAQDEINCAESSLEAFSCEFESEVFNQGFDCLGDFAQALWTASNDQRNALQSRLDAMGKGEAVAWSVTVGDDYKNCIEISHCESDVVAQYEESIAGGFESIYTLHKLYAAPKALAPFAIPADVLEAATNMQKNHYRGPLAWAVKVIDFVAAHGIHAKGGQQ